MKKTAIIIGAGPAGLTAAFELLTRSDIKPIIFEMDQCVGGLSRTIQYKGNRMDIGPHRFFSRSDRVMDFWLKILPLQGVPSKYDKLLGCPVPLSAAPNATDPDKEDRVFLYKNRITRIFFLKNFFDYPITLNFSTLKNLGLIRISKIAATYVMAKLRPRNVEKSLEDFLTNRFGKELYKTFFKDYTEKVWGVPCNQIPADWGAQRVKGLSIRSIIEHAFKKYLSMKKPISLKKTETSLIERFFYPKMGAGQMYEEIARKIVRMGGVINLNHEVTGIQTNGKKIVGVRVINRKTMNTNTVEGDYFFSSMPIKELIKGFDQGITEETTAVADGLLYRSHILVGLLLKNMQLKNTTQNRTLNEIIPDNWIYIQEREVKMGRLDFINNFSIYMLKDRHLIWLGAEYFCNEGDFLWMKPDRDMADLAIEELMSMNMINRHEVVDYTVIRMPKAYPAYFGTYDRFDVIRKFVNQYENLFLIGRNGMHKYNNMDHSILTAMTAVDNIITGVKDKSNIWDINTEKEYHEEK